MNQKWIREKEASLGPIIPGSGATVISLGGCFGLPSTDPRGLKAQSVTTLAGILEEIKDGRKEKNRKISNLDTEYWAGRGHHCFNECKHHLFIFSPPPQTFSTTATYRGLLSPHPGGCFTFAHTCPPTEQPPQCNHEVHCLPCKALSSLRQELGWSRPPPSPQYPNCCLNLVGVQLNTCGQDWMGSPDLRNPFNAVLQAGLYQPI